MSIMNKMPAGIKKLVILVPAIAITLLPFNTGRASNLNISNTIKINILSKHLRLLKEKQNGELVFNFSPGTVIRYDDSEFYSSSLKIQYTGDLYRISAENRLMNFKKCFIYSDKNNTLCKIKINEEERSYPLPIEITYDKGMPKFFIHETQLQYAIDSASAELGYVKPENSEALYALALSIHGRCRLEHLKGKHDTCDFCDLTCCQTYKGRSSLKPFTGPFIDTSSLNCGLFFHSSSGGKLFSESVFSSGGRKTKPPADVIYSENILLSRKLHKAWSAVIAKEDLSSIIFPEKNVSIREMHYDSENEIISIKTDQGGTSIAPEEFRLKINRIKGWNFIKSNNYSISSGSGRYTFRGSGLGHCTGMSLEGAVQLAERGYSRYEILEHYYPDLSYIRNGSSSQSFQYVTFDLKNSNTIISSTGPLLLDRRIPCGSIFKLFTVIYLASERPDIFFNYRFQCSAGNHSPIPEHCWDRKGHGITDISSAISNSCNLYFASLHDRINKEDYAKWFNAFVESIGISMKLPEIKTEKQWSELLAGLDFRIDISIRDLIRLIIFLSKQETLIPPEAYDIISSALHKTFTEGTAKISGKHNPGINETVKATADLWGKTGTVIAGTNSHHSYGLFIGGNKDTGIVTILRKGKGAEAAHLSISLLQKSASDPAESR